MNPANDLGECQIANPYSGDVLTRFRFADRATADNVLQMLQLGRVRQAARARFERADILQRLVVLVKDNAERLARQISLDVGKTIRDARMEVSRCATTLIACAEEARREDGELFDSDSYPPRRRKIALARRRPIGVVAAITPFNFPLNIPAHKIGPAFAAGNTILFKPAPQGYLTAVLFTELCHASGIAADELQLCMLEPTLLREVVASPSIDCVNFTGGTHAGHALAAAAGAKRLLLELGGNDPLIVFADADVNAAVGTAVEQRFGTAGQRCTAPKRVFVHRDIYRLFVEQLVAKTIALKVGDPLDESTDVGPLVTMAAADVVMKRIGDAVSCGARVLCGNRREGNTIYPTVIEHVPPTCELIADETFGPVIPLIAFTDLEEVIAGVNAQPFGLQAGVFTNHLPTIHELFERLDVGAVIVNGGPGFRAEHFPFGGVKSSGLGREGVRSAMREMSVEKLLVL